MIEKWKGLTIIIKNKMNNKTKEKIIKYLERAKENCYSYEEKEIEELKTELIELLNSNTK